MALLAASLSPGKTLPSDAKTATLVGRVWRPDVDGPSVIRLDQDQAVDITAAFATMRDLCETAEPAKAARSAKGQAIGALADILL